MTVPRATEQGLTFAEARDRAGFTQEALAHALRVQVSTVGRWERGVCRPQLWIRPEIAKALGIPESELVEILGRTKQVRPTLNLEDTRILTFNPDEWTSTSSAELDDLLGSGMADPVATDTLMRLAHQWLVADPPQVREVRAGRRVGETLVAGVQRRVAHLRRLDDYIAGGDLHRRVERELRATAKLLRTSAYTEAHGKGLLVAVGELCQLAGWVTADAGIHSRARHYYGVGIKAAEAAGDVALTANLISTLAYHVSNVGKPSEGVILARTAQAGAAQRVTPTTEALFLERIAWAHARAGERRQAEQALGAVERLYERNQPDDDPEWVYWLTEAEIAIMAGRCHIELGIPETGVPILEEAIAHYSEDTARELALYASWLAEGHILLGNIDEAVRQAKRTLQLAGGIASARSDDRVKFLLAKLQPYARVGFVREFADQVREVRYFGSLTQDAGLLSERP